MKRLLQRIQLGLRTKLTVLIETLIVLLVLVTGIITTMREKETLEDELRKRGLAVAADLATFTIRPLLLNDLPSLRRFVNHSMEQDYVRYVMIIDPQGKVIMHSNLDEVGQMYQDQLSLAAIHSEVPGYSPSCIFAQGEHCYDLFVPIQVSGVRLGTVRLGYSYMAVEQEVAKARQQILFIGFVTTMIGIILSYLVATFIASPIKQITRAIGNVANGDLDTRLMIRRNDEIGTLADSFNTMTEDLRRTTISKDYVDSIIGSMNDTLLVIAPDLKIRSANRTTCELLGYCEDELIGKDIHLLVSQEEQVFQHEGFQGLLAEGSIVNYEMDYITKKGTLIPVLFSAAVLKNKDGMNLGVVGIARDVTERKLAEEALRESERELHFLSSQLLKAQEEERRRLSRELHDELGQSLMVLKLKLRSIQTGLLPDQVKLQKDCDEILSYINEVTENVRRLSHDLSPSILEDLGLSAAIRWLVETTTQYCHIQSSLDMADVEQVFSQDSKIMMYRLFQESLTNIVKHAQASRMSIVISKSNDQVVCCIEDDGKGFDVKKILHNNSNKKGLGLVAMYERTRMMGGTLDIWSQRETGTRITITIPFNNGGRQP
ncbi:sensory box histidine kinase/response regulator [Candidatus Vecturithrix granuli]|uniref:histidine kinase n=1 Tax=Vecturithrix granuli TaxID=1499967 RepID=A0A081C9I5_VECG1|nr:sensory box histidine kinase/response regulator [Candidatus Vecturithrix granuli]